VFKAIVNGQVVAIKKFKESDEEDEHVLFKYYFAGTEDSVAGDKNSQVVFTLEHSQTLTGLQRRSKANSCF